ncbi:hypothetical protein KCU88_g3848, partial [Aureobasidium melanogenum]
MPIVRVTVTVTATATTPPRRRGTNPNVPAPRTLANHVVNEKQNATGPGQPVGDAFIPARPATMATARDGGSEMEMLTKFAYRTAEDLTATSRRLARYETLLNQIMPMVSPEVRALIEDARETDGSNASNTSETPEIDFGVPPQRLDSGLVGPGGRIILPLPVPSPHVPVVSRSSTSSGTFEVVPGTTVGPPPSVPPPPSLPSGTPASSSNVSTSQRLSPDSIALTRLPSITSEGILLETGRAPDLSPPPTGPPPLLAQGQLVPDSTGSYGPERLGSLQALPSHTSLGETPRLPQFSPG